MLFNSFPFLFGFLPLALILIYATGKFGRTSTVSKIVLTLLSLGFYAWWRPPHLLILLGSIVFNYFVGGRIQRAYEAERQKQVNLWLALGVAVDLALLGWFKYADFVADNLNFLGAHVHLPHILLPLAISFFTFQKIAYLIDSARGEAKPLSFLDFSLFAAFFPQLIAGPITHYKEVVPQIQSRRFGHLVGRNLMIGLVMLAIGLFKKTVIADTFALYANPLFDTAAKTTEFDPLGGLLAAVTFTLQVYFDFSGYSDMAIGLGRMFGVKLPLNFHSPLRAESIIDYWRRWHMTLQRFIVAYIFQPLTLPLSRFAAVQRLSAWPTFFVSMAIPSFVTFVCVGFWHGGRWTYICYGALHASFICINQYWLERRAQKQRALRRQKRSLPEPGAGRKFAFRILTLVAILFSNVIFRAKQIPDALTIWRGMLGFGRTTLAPETLDVATPVLGGALLLSAFIIFFMPNTQQIMRRFDPAWNWEEWRDAAPPIIRWTWTPSPMGIAFAAAALFFGLMFIQRGQAIFVYFNF